MVGDLRGQCESCCAFFLSPFHWLAQGNARWGHWGGGAANGPQMKANRESEMAKFFFYHSLFLFTSLLNIPIDQYRINLGVGFKVFSEQFMTHQHHG
jgi:hypothetical protein